MRIGLMAIRAAMLGVKKPKKEKIRKEENILNAKEYIDFGPIREKWNRK